MIRRGEFKTPGGKLIAIEFDASDGTLRNVVVTGDFFLYPDEALDRLSGALEGAPASLSGPDYAERIGVGLSGEVELLGSSAEALATAVIRALHDPDERDGAGGR